MRFCLRIKKKQRKAEMMMMRRRGRRRKKRRRRKRRRTKLTDKRWYVEPQTDKYTNNRRTEREDALIIHGG